MPGAGWASRRACPGVGSLGEGEAAGGKALGSPEGNRPGPRTWSSLRVSSQPWGPPGPCSSWRRGLGGTPKTMAHRCHLFILSPRVSATSQFRTSLSLLGSPRGSWAALPQTKGIVAGEAS